MTGINIAFLFILYEHCFKPIDLEKWLTKHIYCIRMFQLAKKVQKNQPIISIS